MTEIFKEKQLNNQEGIDRLSIKREDVDRILQSENFQPEELVDFMEGYFKQAYEADAGVWEGYSIREHTVMVMNQFEKYYCDKEMPAGIDRNFFRFLLSVHDIGKADAVKLGDKTLQHQFTLKTAKPLFEQLGFSDQEWCLFESIVGGDSLGDYIKGSKSINKTFSEILEANKKTGLSLRTYLDILEIYYKVDAGSYTKDAGGLESLDRLFNLDAEKRSLDFSKGLENKVNLLENRIDNYEEQEEKNLANVEKSDLYQRILSEAQQIIIKPENYNENMELTAPNGEPSNLLEREWKIVRTPSFKKWFGDWERKYNKEDQENWVKYQYLKSLEEKIIPFYNTQIEGLEKDIIQSRDQNNEQYAAKYAEFLITCKKRKVETLHEISKVQAEIVNGKFNPHLSDYGKIIDKNGEPLVLWRATDYGSDNTGHFEIPLMGEEMGHGGVRVGVFLGEKAEALYHHKDRLQEGGNSCLYRCFANVKDVDILSEKFYWGSNKERIKDIQKKHDGIIVKQDKGELFKDGKINLMDLIVFDPNNVLIVGIE